MRIPASNFRDDIMNWTQLAPDKGAEAEIDKTGAGGSRISAEEVYQSVGWSVSRAQSSPRLDVAKRTALRGDSQVLKLLEMESRHVSRQSQTRILSGPKTSNRGTIREPCMQIRPVATTIPQVNRCRTKRETGTSSAFH